MAEQTLTIKLTEPLAIFARAALMKFLKVSQKLQADAEEMKDVNLAAREKLRREALADETMEKLTKAATMATKKKPAEVDLTPMEWRAIDAGIPKLIVAIRAAKGTVSSLLKTKWKEQLEADAVSIEKDLAPLFAEQLEAFGAEPAPAGEEEGKVLASIGGDGPTIPLEIGDAAPKEDEEE